MVISFLAAARMATFLAAVYRIVGSRQLAKPSAVVTSPCGLRARAPAACNPGRNGKPTTPAGDDRVWATITRAYRPLTTVANFFANL